MRLRSRKGPENDLQPSKNDSLQSTGVSKRGKCNRKNLKEIPMNQIFEACSPSDIVTKIGPKSSKIKNSSKSKMKSDDQSKKCLVSDCVESMRTRENQ